MTDFAIEVHGLTKRFGERAALTELDLAVRVGACSASSVLTARERRR